MAIFGRSQKKVFRPSLYESRRRTRRLPRWFVLLLVGIVLGAGGVLILQASYGPKRLTVSESQKLTDELATTTHERRQLQADLEEVERARETENAQATQTTQELQARVDELEIRLKPLQDEIKLLTRAISAGMKFDPIGIAAASFEPVNNKDIVKYQILLLQENEKKPSYDGRIEVTFEGVYPNGRAGAVKALVVPFTLDHYEQLNGDVEMPKGFKPSRATLRVYQAQGDKALTYRTYNIAGK